MPMPSYPVLCFVDGCGRPAEFKIAAHWSDGVTAELKTYSLCCAEHLTEQYRLSRGKQRQCLRAPGETLDLPGIFHRQRGRRDQQLQRLPELEGQLNTEA